MGTHTSGTRSARDRRPLDATDVRILALLHRDAGRTNKELAREVGLAESSCLERVRRLRTEGVITGIHADVDLDALGVGLNALLHVRLKRSSRRAVEAFRADALALPEVRAAFLLGAEYDFVLHVAVPTVAALRTLTFDRLAVRNDVREVQTTLVLEASKSAALPLPRETDETPPVRG